MPSLRTRRSARAQKLLGLQSNNLNRAGYCAACRTISSSLRRNGAAEVEERYVEPQDARGGTKRWALSGPTAAWRATASPRRSARAPTPAARSWTRSSPSGGGSSRASTAQTGRSTLQVNLSIGSRVNFGAAAHRKRCRRPIASRAPARSPSTAAATRRRERLQRLVLRPHADGQRRVHGHDQQRLQRPRHSTRLRARTSSRSSRVELAHVLGMISDKGDTAGSWQLYSIEDFSVDTGIARQRRRRQQPSATSTSSTGRTSIT